LPRFRQIQNSFTGGEISPESFGRTDLERYFQSVEELQNGIVRFKGGIQRRPGSQFILKEAVQRRIFSGNAINGGAPLAYTGKARIIPFVFNRTETYAVILTSAETNSTSTISIINVDTLAEATYSWGQGTIFPVDRAPFTTGLETIRFQGYQLDSELDEIQYAQSGDLLYLTHPNYPPWILARTGTDAFENRSFVEDPSGKNRTTTDQLGSGVPYQILNLDGTLTMTVTAGFNNTIQSSAPYFTIDDVGSWIKLDTGGGNWFYFFLGEFISSTEMRVGDYSPLGAGAPAVGPTATWAHSAIGNPAGHAKGWPRSVTFFQQRLFYGGLEQEPDTVYGSQIGDVFEFDQQPKPAGTITNDLAFSFTVASTQVNEIQYLSSGRVLNIGTLGREYIAQGQQGALGPTDITVSAETAFGAAYRQPVRLENTMLFISRNGNKIREFVFNRDEESFVANDLTQLADHIINRKVIELGDTANKPQFNHLVKQETTETIIWGIDNNGGMQATTRDRLSEINGFSYHELGGNLGGNSPFIHSIASIPSADGTNEDLWIAVERTVNGADVTYIERINKEFTLIDPKNPSASILDKLVYVDSAVFKRDGLGFNIFDGLDHLEGETIQVVADGTYLGEYTVSSGQVDLVNTYTDAVGGLKYVTRIRTLPLEGGVQTQSAQGALKRIDSLWVRLYRTIGMKVGSVLTNLEEVIFRDDNLPLNEPIPLFTGDKKVQLRQSPGERAQYYIVQDLPLPMTVVALIERGVGYD
jgi:hypothetical protein